MVRGNAGQPGRSVDGADTVAHDLVVEAAGVQDIGHGRWFQLPDHVPDFRARFGRPGDSVRN